MLRSLYSSVFRFWVRIANIGVSEALNFHETKKTQLLNVVVASGIPLNLGFCIVNFLQAKSLLAVINLLLLLGAILVLIINSRQRFLLSRLIMTFLASILFMMGAVFFRNGGEYYLITNLIVIIIYFNERIYIILISLFNCLFFLAAKIYLEHAPSLYGTVPFGRVVFNIAWALLVMVLALLYFKKEQRDYLVMFEEKNRELEALNASRQKLFSIIAHDLRSPIGQLKNSLDMVSNQYMTQDVFRQVAAKLSSEVDQLHSTLDNLLRWSVSQLNGTRSVPEKISLTDMVRRKATLFKQLLDTKNIVLNWELNNLSVYADPDHFLLVLRNILSNAIKYSYPNGSIYVHAQREGNEVIISITDHGTGMKKEVADGLFKDDTILSQAGTQNEKGTGLGLKLCDEFIRKNNGTLAVVSEEGKGTTFYITLPLG